MIESEKHEQHMPATDEDQQQQQINDLDPHGQKLIERILTISKIEDKPSGYAEAGKHHQQVEQH
jgi:hypothetical protein